MKWSFKWGKKNKKKRGRRAQSTAVRVIDYPDKIILAWSAAVTGDKKIQQWLLDNGYEELNVFVFALYNKEEARDWLVENGFAHLMALINCAEGNESAFDWLSKHKFDTLKYVGIAGDGQQEGYLWLKRYELKAWAHLAKNIQAVKDNIEERHNDIHHFGND